MPSGANAQLAENARLLLSEQSPCAKHFYLGDFDVTLHKSDASAKLDEGCIPHRGLSEILVPCSLNSSTS